MKLFRFGVVGDFQSGKSTLINCILHRFIASVGKGTSTTHAIVNYIYGKVECVEYYDKNGTHTESLERLSEIESRSNIDEINVVLSSSFLRNFILTDMPGFGYNRIDDTKAEIALSRLDFAIVVTTNVKAAEEESNLLGDIIRLRKYHIPYYLIMNCVDISNLTWSPHHPANLPIAQKNRNQFSFYHPLSFPFENNETPIVNLLWYWFSICNKDDLILNHYKSSYEQLISRATIDDIGKASNFYLINKIFSMENRDFLELSNIIKEQVQQLRDELCPIGTIQSFAFQTIPKGWLICDGTTLPISEYLPLFKAIGNVFGGDGKECFRIPDLQGRFVRGWARKDGRKFGTFQNHAIQGHSHEFNPEQLTVNISSNGSHSHTVRATTTEAQDTSLFSTDIKVLKWLSSSGSDSTSSSSEGSHSHSASVKVMNCPVGNVADSDYGVVEKSCNETRPANVNLLFCIRAE